MPRLTYIDATTKQEVALPVGGLPPGTLLVTHEGKRMGVKNWMRRFGTKATRTALLREFAEKKFDSNFSYEYRRFTRKFDEAQTSKEKRRHFLHPVMCSVCGYTHATSFHHIVLIKNGGSDFGANRIPICSECHRNVHPWMKPPLPREKWLEIYSELQNK